MMEKIIKNNFINNYWRWLFSVALLLWAALYLQERMFKVDIKLSSQRNHNNRRTQKWKRK